MTKRNWNTYATYGYSYQAGTDPRATGGVHLHQVRRTRSGWQRRTVDANGLARSPGPVASIPDAEGEAKYATARNGGAP